MSIVPSVTKMICVKSARSSLLIIFNSACLLYSNRTVVNVLGVMNFFYVCSNSFSYFYDEISALKFICDNIEQVS